MTVEKIFVFLVGMLVPLGITVDIIWPKHSTPSDMGVSSTNTMS